MAADVTPLQTGAHRELARVAPNAVARSNGHAPAVRTDDPPPPREPLPPDFERLPPQDLQAEQSVLGGMLLSSDAITDVIDTLAGPGDFYRPAHQTIYDTIVDLYGRGEPVDVASVFAALTRGGHLARIGGGSYLHDLIHNVPTAANAGYYAEIVAGKAVLRRLIEAGTRIVQIGYNADTGGTIGNDEAVDRAQAEVYDITGRSSSSDTVPITQLLLAHLDELEARGGRGPVAGVPTGITDLDHMLLGLNPGELVVLAARPGLGKSCAGLDWMRRCSLRDNHASVIFSLEMSRTEIMDRLLAAEARVPLTSIRSGRLRDDELARIATRMGEITDAPLHIDDSPNLNIAEIRSKARRLKQRSDLRLVVVDYLQLMTSGRRVESRQVEVAEFSRQLKLLAKELEVPVVAISQLNRGPELRHDKRPLLADLRESGSIENDADKVVLIHREDAYDPNTPRIGEADFIVAKNRNGPTGTVTTAFQGHYSRFVDIAATAKGAT